MRREDVISTVRQIRWSGGVTSKLTPRARWTMGSSCDARSTTQVDTAAMSDLMEVQDTGQRSVCYGTQKKDDKVHWRQDALGTATIQYD